MNYGLKFDKPDKRDFVLGASHEILVPDGNWEQWLPNKEYQADITETSGCVSFTTANCVEIILRRKYGLEVNLSDLFILRGSGTDAVGNTPRRVFNFFRKYGAPDESVYPLTEENLAKNIPPSIYAVAREFVREWEFSYYDVPVNGVEYAIKRSPLLVSVPAWFEKNGVYYNPEGYTDNHATTCFKEKDGMEWLFDTYAPDVKQYMGEHMIVKAFELKERTIPLRENWLLDLVKRLLVWKN